MTRQALFQFGLGHALNLAQQRVRDFGHLMTAAQFFFEMQGKAGGHFGVGQRAVGAPRDGQIGEFDQRPELVAGRLRQQAARKQQGTGEGLLPLQPDAGQLGIPELAVEAGV